MAPPDLAATAAATADAPPRRYDEPQLADLGAELKAPNPEPLNCEQPGEVPTDITQFQSLNKTPLLNLEEDDLLEEALKGIARKVKEELEN